MNNITKAVKYYYIASELKEVVRQGPIRWGVDKAIMETVASHVFGTLMLAFSLYNELKPEINFEKTFLMLALHELEEIVIGDITPLDNVSKEEKNLKGEKAVKQILGKLNNTESFVSLIKEFDNQNTPEAKFAHAIDKLECVLEFKKSVDFGLTGLHKATPEILKMPNMQEYIDLGYDLSDIFYFSYLKDYEYLGFSEELWFSELKHLSSDFNELL